MELPNLQNDEFLPPINRWLTWGGIFLVGTFFATIGLASVTRYNPSIQVKAIVRPSGELQTIQTPITGTIKKILVKENQNVKAGEVIAEMDNTTWSKQKQQLQQTLDQCQTELDLLNQQIKSLENQIGANLAMRGVQSQKSVDQNLLQLTNIAPDLAAKLAQERRTLLVKRTELVKSILQGKRELYKIGENLSNTTILSPTDGTILRLDLKNPGQTVELGNSIAQIVPNDVPLVLKAKVDSADIGQVKVGQPVQIKITAYPFPDYGTLKGFVSSIAPDVIIPPIESNPNHPYYEVIITPETPYLMRNSRQYGIRSGMEGKAEIIWTQETILTFILRKVRMSTNL